MSRHLDHPPALRRRGTAPLAAATIALMVVAAGCTGSGRTALPSPASTTAGTVAGGVPGTAGSGPASTSAAPLRALIGPAEPGDTRSDAWVVESLSAGPDDEGLWAGTATVRNEPSEVRSSSFSFTIVRDGQPVATLVGEAEAVAGGAAITVKLESADGYANGDHRYRFNAGLRF